MSTSNAIITELISRHTIVERILFHIIKNSNDIVSLQQQIEKNKQKQLPSAKNKDDETTITILQGIINEFQSDYLPDALKKVESIISDAKRSVATLARKERNLIKRLPFFSESKHPQYSHQYIMSTDHYSSRVDSTVTQLINIISSKITLQFAILYSNMLLDCLKIDCNQRNISLYGIFYSALGILSQDCTQGTTVLPKQDRKILIEKISLSSLCSFNRRVPKTEEIKTLCDGLSQELKNSQAFKNAFSK